MLCLGTLGNEQEADMELSQDLVRGSIVPIVLSLLNERPMYGYEMVKLVTARSRGKEAAA
jgi:DNA-binding PadR family transcriptional regulator